MNSKCDILYDLGEKKPKKKNPLKSSQLNHPNKKASLFPFSKANWRFKENMMYDLIFNNRIALFSLLIVFYFYIGYFIITSKAILLSSVNRYFKSHL